MPLLTPTPYATLADLTTYGLSVAARGTLPTGEQQRHLDSANALIDSYIASKFTLPVVAWGPDLVRCAAEIAAFNIIAERGFDPEDAGDKVFKDRYDGQIAWLKLVGKGEATPTVQDSAAGGKGGAGANNFTTQSRTRYTTTQGSLDGNVTVTGDPQSGQVFVTRPSLRGWDS